MPLSPGFRVKKHASLWCPASPKPDDLHSPVLRGNHPQQGVLMALRDFRRRPRRVQHRFHRGQSAGVAGMKFSRIVSMWRMRWGSVIVSLCQGSVSIWSDVLNSLPARI